MAVYLKSLNSKIEAYWQCFVLALGGTKPTAPGLDNNVDGKTEDKDNALALSSFDNSASIVGTSVMLYNTFTSFPILLKLILSSFVHV